MKPRLAPWLRACALALILLLAGQVTGAFAALTITARHDECCHAPSSPPCPVLWCTLGCCPARAVALEDDAMALNFSATRERWPVTEQFGLARRAKPPVPPPRG